MIQCEKMIPSEYVMFGMSAVLLVCITRWMAGDHHMRAILMMTRRFDSFCRRIPVLELGWVLSTVATATTPSDGT